MIDPIDAVFAALANPTRRELLRLLALPHENLPCSSSSRHFPTTLLWPFLQDRTVAHLLGSRRSTWHSLEKKRKIFHEASLPLVVASAHSSHDARFQRREEWNGR